VVEQLVFVIAALIAFVAPTSIGLMKFHRITSYHTRLAKLVAIVMGAGLILYLGFGVPALFQGAVLFLLVEAIEEIAITAVLPEWRADVSSLFAALKIARAAKPALVIALALLGLSSAASAQLLPDLVPEVSDVQVEFSATVAAGDVAEGCAAARTGRDLVRLSLTTRNDGPGAETLGNPMCPICETHPGDVCGNPDFICSPAGGHNHAHYRNFLRYEIVDPNQVIAAVGGKRSFCLAETACLTGGGEHTCANQGLDPGCWDIYSYYLGCQYVDVTDLPDGLYSLRVTVDPLQQIDEASEDNNMIEVPVLIMRELLTDTSLEGGELLFNAGHVFRMSARAPERLALFGEKSDPTLAGATLYLRDTIGGDQIGFGLSASGWKRVGKARDPRAYRYRGKRREDGACSSVEISRTTLRAQCNLRGEHTHFALPAQGNVFVELRLGAAERRFCASFGGDTLRNDAVLVRRRGAPPTNCDTGT
jgi:hypothetical protein